MMTNVANMEMAIVDFDRQLINYEKCANRKERLDSWFAEIDDEIADAKSRIKCELAEIERLKQFKIEVPERIREMEEEEKNILSSWDGTIIKDEEDDEEISTSRRVPKRKCNRRFPCGNHTYKDLRYLGDSENRKCMKVLCEKRAKREFLAREARLTLAAFEEHQDYVEDWG